MITRLDPDILECEVKWVLGRITMNKASGGDGIPVPAHPPITTCSPPHKSPSPQTANVPLDKLLATVQLAVVSLTFSACVCSAGILGWLPQNVLQ